MFCGVCVVCVGVLRLGCVSRDSRLDFGCDLKHFAYLGIFNEFNEFLQVRDRILLLTQEVVEVALRIESIFSRLGQYFT